MRYCIIINGEVINTILWDGKTRLDLPKDATIVPEEEAKELPRRVVEEDPAEVAERNETETIKSTLAALKAGAGTAGERLARIERVLFHLAKRILI